MLHEGFGFLVLWVMLVRVGNKLLVRSPKAEGHRLEQIEEKTIRIRIKTAKIRVLASQTGQVPSASNDAWRRSHGGIGH